MSYLKLHTVSAPSTPASGAIELFADISTKRLHQIHSTGTIKQLGVPTSWYDVTDWGLVGDGSTDNLAAMNVLVSILPVNATVFFPAGTYNFSNTVTIAANLQLLFQGCGRSRSILQTTHATADLFAFTIPSYYYSFWDLGFRCTQTRTAGNAVNAQSNNAYLEFIGCEFQNQFNAVNLAGAIAGNVGYFLNSHFNTPAPGGAQVILNGSNINIMFDNVNINCGTVASACMLVNQCGALQICNSDFIGGTYALNLNATAVISAVKISNTFFDQSSLATIAIQGSGSTTRVQILGGGITLGPTNNGATAVLVAGTGTGTNIPDGIELIGVDLYNSGSSAATTSGVLATGVRNLIVRECKITGFTNGLDVTPYNGNGVTAVDIQNNNIGAFDNFAANGTGIQLRAGSFTYGAVNVEGNRFGVNTVAQITDNSTVISTGSKVITGNTGTIVSAPPGNFAATSLPLTTITNVDPRGGMFIHAGFRPVSVRITVYATNAATTQTLTTTVRYGTTNTNADAAVYTQALTAGTAVVGSGVFVFEIDIPTATSLFASFKFFNGNNAVTGIGANISLFTSLAAAATIATTANSWLGVYFSSATAAAVTIRSVKYEMLSQ